MSTRMAGIEDRQISIYGEEVRYRNVDYAAYRLAGAIPWAAGYKEFRGMDLAVSLDDGEEGRAITVDDHATGNQITVSVRLDEEGARRAHVLMATMDRDKVLLSTFSVPFGHRMVNEVAKELLRDLKRTPEAVRAAAAPLPAVAPAARPGGPVMPPFTRRKKKGRR